MRARTRRHLVLHTLPLLCSGALLLACGTPPAPGGRPQAVMATADDSYLRGRNLHLARRHDEAIAAYQAALRADAGHLDARNGLAIAYAERRDFARAIPIWRELTRGASMASGASMAFLFVNLGYAQFLAGEADEALVSLEKACLLDPLDARAWQYLGETLQKLGQEERARQMLRQASALREHDLRADYAAVGGGKPAAVERALVTAPRPDQEWAFVEVREKDNGMLELRRVAAAPGIGGTAAAPAGTSPVRPGPAAIAALEISNGNGRQGLARQLSRQLRDPGFKVVRLSNEKGFGVRQTRVEYQPAFRGVAERLAQRFGASQPVEVRLAGRADVRLVIGHDLPPAALARDRATLPVGYASRADSP